MKQSQIGLAILLIISIVFNIIQYQCIKNITQPEIKSYKEKDSIFTLREQRQECMVKTLMNVYDLGKWESHYYSIIFDDFSQKFNIPWEIYPAVIQVESRFKCNVVSPKGAKGLMQIMESSGELLAAQIDMKYVKGMTLWNDFSNLILGCYYLSECIKDQGLEGGVSSYIGGPAHLKNEVADTSVAKDIKSYRTTVGKEYKTLFYIYQGIISEKGYNYKNMHSFPYADSIIIDMNLFSTIK